MSGFKLDHITFDFIIYYLFFKIIFNLNKLIMSSINETHVMTEEESFIIGAFFYKIK